MVAKSASIIFSYQAIASDNKLAQVVYGKEIDNISSISFSTGGIRAVLRGFFYIDTID
jgi:hypothetical protein